MSKNSSIETKSLLLMYRMIDNKGVNDVCLKTKINCVSFARPKVFLYRDKNELYVVFRGTSRRNLLHNISVNFTIKTKEIKNGIKIHKGFYKLYENVKNILTKAIRNEEKKKNRTKLKTIIFCGPSLGGALSVIASWDFKLNHNIRNLKIKNITCGLPPVGNKTFINSYTPDINHKHFMLYKDPISMLKFRKMKFQGITKRLGYHEMPYYQILKPIAFTLIHHSMYEYLWVFLNTFKNKSEKIKTFKAFLNQKAIEYKNMNL